MGTSGGAKDAPDNVGAAYGVNALDSANIPERIIDDTTETSSLLVVAPNANGGPVYLGWDDQVTVNNGTPVFAGKGISFDIDNQNATLFMVGNNAGDELRYIATG